MVATCCTQVTILQNLPFEDVCQAWHNHELRKIKRGGSDFLAFTLCWPYNPTPRPNRSEVIKLCISWPCFGASSEAEGIFSLDVGESVMSYIPQREATLESSLVVINCIEVATDYLLTA